MKWFIQHIAENVMGLVLQPVAIVTVVATVFTVGNAVTVMVPAKKHAPNVEEVVL